MLDRRLARKLVLEILYEREITGTSWQEIAQRRLKPGTNEADFCRHLLKGVVSNQETVDRLIGEYTKNWVLERLPLIDRNILRLAIYEMEFEPSIPMSVSINEAVELAKEYGGTDSSKFINGVLGQLASGIDGSRAGPTSETKEAQ